MNIGILGSGIVAQTISRSIIKAGHRVMISTRNKEKLQEWIDEVGDKGNVGSFMESANFGELIILATHGLSTPKILEDIDKTKFLGKTVIDLTNPLDFSEGTPPKLISSPLSSMGEKIQRIIPDAKVVKAFNTISADIMINPKRKEGTPDLFLCGNKEIA